MLLFTNTNEKTFVINLQILVKFSSINSNDYLSMKNTMIRGPKILYFRARMNLLYLHLQWYHLKHTMCCHNLLHINPL